MLADTFNDDVPCQAQAVQADLSARRFSEALEHMRSQRQSVLKADPCLTLPPLKLFVPGKTPKHFEGCRAYAHLIDFLAALAVMDEVLAVSPEFACHLQAAAECLTPLLRKQLDAQAKQAQEIGKQRDLEAATAALAQIAARPGVVSQYVNLRLHSQSPALVAQPDMRQRSVQCREELKPLACAITHEYREGRLVALQG